MFRRLIAAAISISAVLALAAPAGAGGKVMVLGTDPALDSPPGLDLTAIAVGNDSQNLQIQLQFANSIPVAGTYGPLVGMDWFFEVRGKTYLAEAFPEAPNATEFGYILFEMNGDTAKQIAFLEGDFDTIGGILNMYVPLKTIGAKKGTVITGAGENDGDVHVHAGVTTVYPEVMTTSKSYRVH